MCTVSCCYLNFTPDSPPTQLSSDQTTTQARDLEKTESVPFAFTAALLELYLSLSFPPPHKILQQKRWKGFGLNSITLFFNPWRHSLYIDSIPFLSLSSKSRGTKVVGTQVGSWLTIAEAELQHDTADCKRSNDRKSKERQRGKG